MAEALDLSTFVQHSEGTAHLELAVEGVACAGCIGKIEGSLKQLPGVVDARLNFTNRRLVVDWRENELGAADLMTALERAGYRAYPFQPERAETEEAQHMRWLLKCLGLSGFAAMNIMLLSVSVWSGHVTDMGQETRDFFHWVSALIALPAAAYAGQPFFQSAVRAIRARALNMDVPISLGVITALGMSLVETATHAAHAYFDSATMLLFFLLCGRALDHAMRRKTRAVAGNLAALKADFAHKFDGTELVLIPAAALQVGDRLLVRPGDRLPADGVVLSGASEIDESVVTGETLLRAVVSGAAVHAGSVNFSGTLTMRVTAAGVGTLIDEVERLLEKAVTAKSRYVRLADRAARMYAPVVHATAALTVAAWLIAGASMHDAVVTAIAVLIITCPCALALAIPAVQVVASGALFRAGVVLNAGDAIERFAEIDTVVFDKTGTLTLPEPRVANAAYLPADLLETAARLALSSRHPLAVAVAKEARERIPFEGVNEEVGQGVRVMIDGAEARLGSPMFCGVSKIVPVGAAVSVIAFSHNGANIVLTVRQRLREDAIKTAALLRARGLRLIILSGDRSDAVLPVASALGIADWKGGLKPADKIAAIESLKAQGRRVLMVGDGINDAPALAAAHASLSPISGADLTQAQADAVFLGERLQPVRDALAISRRARWLMQQNLWLAVIYNAIAVPVAILGYATPLVAAAAMSGSSILVTLNALRVRTQRQAGIMSRSAETAEKSPSKAVAA